MTPINTSPRRTAHAAPTHHADTDISRLIGKVALVSDDAVAAFGRLDVLVNHAGVVGPNKPTHKLTEAEWDRVQAVKHLATMGGDVQQHRCDVGALHPLGPMGEPDDIAWGVVYLASEESKFMTGSELVIKSSYSCR